VTGTPGQGEQRGRQERNDAREARRTGGGAAKAVEPALKSSQ
jgi:hypothetical protein